MPDTQLRTTGLSRRHGPVVEGLQFASRFVGGTITPEPAVAAALPRPHGEFATASVSLLSSAAGAVAIWPDTPRATRLNWTHSTRTLLEYLLTFPGETWQQRWDVSPLGRGEVDAEAVASRRTTGRSIVPGIRALYCLRVIRPTLLALRRNPLPNFGPTFIAAQEDPLLDTFAEHVRVHQIRHVHRRDAINEVCMVLASQDVALSDVTPAALLHFAHENRKARCILRPGSQASNRLAGRGIWNVLHAMGHFPPSTPESMRAASLRGQLSVEELVDQYEITNQAVRGLLIDYLARRKADTDYSTLKDLACKLTRHFWRNIEKINPDQKDLRISPETYTAWRQVITIKDDGKPRVGQDSIVIALRSFYYDLHTWAAEEPERWAVWVAPCPVPPSELRGLGARRRRINERSADRTRQRQPLLPLLVNHVETRYDRARLLLEQADKTADGEAFTHEGIEYRRIRTEADRKLLRHGDAVPTRVQQVDSGRIIHIGTEEEGAFWEWAAVETLRHSGVRIEELCELTHLSIRQYQRANGEVIALLVIAPSKTDRERVIPMSAELFHVIASIVRRHTRTGRPIPLVSRFDYHDKVWSAPMPFLFQRQNGTTPMVFSTATIQVMLGRICDQLAKIHQEFRGLKFTPHDFRRIFATELVNSGLPIHIGAALMGHLDVQTTRGYVAVFDEDVIRHYQEFIHHRREVRPEGEYRDTTDQEWDEFEDHFDRRKVELGSCGRPYGTPCQHEHACIRCPMLHINPKMLGRLEELEADLLARLQQAEGENWLGEVEGINLTLTFLRGKREETQRRAQRPTVELGIPARRLPGAG
ncbi:tyrosine-type recombinase/integrase [Streptomyces sp. NPDC057621]|uniref:tyrosine-type recombinase/integrase n=1 Tax=Streptomyces sp. NPDC057621 TaxID=3346186 RepID=UPI0036AA2E8F